VSRAYLRVDPMLYERKVVDQGYPLPLFAAFVGVLCLAEHQPQRGVFRNERVCKALLGSAGRLVGELITRGDLVRRDGHLYVDGWDEWQEGDWKVGERVKRIRTRTRVTGQTVTDVTVATVDTPSDGDRLSVIDSGGVIAERTPPTPPPERGTRSSGANPRAIAAALTRKAEEAEKARKHRRQQRYLAYASGRLTEAQRIDMDERDAPLDEIAPGVRPEYVS
jgi:hypothetical protein